MNPQIWWHLTRATGIVAWALAVGSVLWGVALSTRALGAKPRAPWLLDLHRFLGAATVAFVALHLGALVADSYVHFGAADLVVPFATDWKPLAVALGIVAFWLLLVVEVTSLARARLPKRVWRAVHLTSYAVAALSTAHLLAAGTDAGNPVLRVVALAWVPVTAFFLVYRWLAPRRAANRIPAGVRDRSRAAALQPPPPGAPAPAPPAPPAHAAPAPAARAPTARMPADRAPTAPAPAPARS